MYRKLLIVAALCLIPLAGANGAPAAGLGQLCGGIAGIKCAKGLWCQFYTGQCRIPDAGGTCARAPKICPRIFLPVCGCDGKTYPNDCERQAHKVSKLHNGKCW